MTKQKSVMLGEISAREIHGPWADFMDKLQNENGREDWFEPFKRFLRKENPWERKKNYTFLTPHEEFIVGPLTKSFNPHKFFKTGDDLRVSDDFVERILSVAKVAKPSEAVSLQSFNLMRMVHDSEIRTELPEEGLTELWHIAELIKHQSNGEEGRLLNNGYGTSSTFAEKEARSSRCTSTGAATSGSTSCTRGLWSSATGGMQAAAFSPATDFLSL